MNHLPIESTYPISFRSEDAQRLGELLKNRRSVVLVGMKRVGISNFLRFFLTHPEAEEKYIQEKNHIIITVDLHDLVEREIFPFWILTLKRISDFVESHVENKSIKKKVSQLFLDSIQSQDVFLTIDSIKKSIQLLIDEGLLPTIFFIRFDRIIDAATPSFFANFQGLIDATQRKIAFVFTSVRPLSDLSPTIFTKHALSVFTDTIYIKPAKKEDVKIILNAFAKEQNLLLSSTLQNELLRLVDGYNQYLQFALIILKEQKTVVPPTLSQLLSDERIGLQSEELWESLTNEEKHLIEQVAGQKKLKELDRETGGYLFKTGYIDEHDKIFSKIFEEYVQEKINQKKDHHILELSKKEHLLLTFLEGKHDEICEREEIIEYVWPEAENVGVSDWAIDRLVSRLRSKLKNQNSSIEIITIKTRGYKLMGKI